MTTLLYGSLCISLTKTSFTMTVDACLKHIRFFGRITENCKSITNDYNDYITDTLQQYCRQSVFVVNKS